jgi:hypothetical protein
MPPGQARANLRKLYPTLKHYDNAIAKHGSQQKLAEALGISVVTLCEHKFWLVHGKRHIADQPFVCRFTNKELDKRVSELFGCKREVMKVYQLAREA